MIEQVALTILGIALAYLISEINQMQKHIQILLLDVAVSSSRDKRANSVPLGE